MASYVTELRFIPDDMDQDDEMALMLCVTVRYRGYGKYSVERGIFKDIQLSSAKRWQTYPPARNRRFYRFDLETACRLAEEVLPTVTMNGYSWESLKAARAKVPC
jgi:hypothetical protein